MRFPVVLLLVLSVACAPRSVPPPPSPATPSPPTLAALSFPGAPEVAETSRDVLRLWLSIHPAVAADAGLLADGVALPTFDASVVAERLGALRAADARLAALTPSAPADRIDVRLLRATVAGGIHALEVERRWTHRPAEWLEPLSSLLIAHAAAVEPLEGAVEALAAGVPAMVEEMRREVVAPTAEDVRTALGLLEGVAGMFDVDATAGRVAAAKALRTYRDDLASRTDLPPFRMIGPEAYAFRLREVLLLPWTPEELLARAEADLAAVDAEIAALEAGPIPWPDAADEERALAAGLDQAGVNALYDRMVAEQLDALRAMDVVTIPEDLPPLRARPTPAALIPLTGDGGSMNPVPFYGPTDGAWWNVENFRGAAPDQALGLVLFMRRHDRTWFGPYAAHEGVPGHHLHFAVARGVDRPVRLLASSTPAIEGWGLYAEGLFEEGGGFGGTSAGRLVTLRSYRARIKRVVFDVKVETGVWTLQEAADWKHGVEPGAGRIDPELLRTVQWPTQLIGYYAGREEIESLRDELRVRWGEGFTLRRFHDALLAQGPIPVSLARDALLSMPAEAPPTP